MISLKDLVNAWDNFFFKAQPVDSIALFRVLWCFLLLIVLLLDIGNVSDFYGPHAITSLMTVKGQFPSLHMNVFHLFNSSYEFVYILFSLYAVALLFSLFGLYTRTSLTIVLICMVSFHQRNIWLLSSSELLMRVVTLLMIFSPCGNAYSIDSILGRKFETFKRPKEWSPWVLRLIQIQISVIYLWTVWHKLKGENWLDGTAVYYATRIEAMKNFPVPFLLDWMPFIKMATWGTILIELALGLLVWFKEFRRPVILIGIVFHLGIEYMMSIPFFEWIMISLLFLYFTPEEVRAFVLAKKTKWLENIKRSTVSDSLKARIQWVIGE